MPNMPTRDWVRLPNGQYVPPEVAESMMNGVAGASPAPAGTPAQMPPSFDQDAYLAGIGERYAGNILPDIQSMQTGISPMGGQMPPQPNPAMMAMEQEDSPIPFPPNPVMMDQEVEQQPTEQPEEAPMGLLARLGQSFSGIDRGDALMALGSGMLGLSQDAGLQRLGMAGFGQVAENKKTRQATAQTNKTVAELRRMKRNDLADAVESGMMPASEAAKILFADSRTALQKDFEFAQSQGYKGGFEQFMKDKKDGVSIYTGDNMGGMNEDYLKQGNTLLAKRHMLMVENGDNARRNNQALQQIEALNPETPDGFGAGVKAFAGQYGIQLGENVDNVQAMQAVINRLVPDQRPAGSGPMSDADLDLFKRSLPQLMQSTEGRQLVVDLIKDINAYDIQRADIAEQMLYGDIDQKTGRDLLKQLDERTTSLRERIKGNSTVVGDF